MTVARVALPVPARTAFDYWVPEGLPVARGAMVRVRLARRALVGVVIEARDDSDIAPERLQPIDEVIALPPLPPDVIALAEFVAEYYQAAPGEALALAVPPPGQRTRRLPRVSAATAEVAATRTPNAMQQAAIDAIDAARGTFAPFLLQGITGSGKTDVYLGAAQRAIAAGGQVLVLVPEINLTPQFEARVQAALPGHRAVTLHSGLPDGARRAHWLAAANGDADLILGTRLAVFCPAPRLSLVVVDEEHDGSYKQQDGVRYHARDVAVWRAHARGVPIVLGSATPSLESYAHAEAGRYRRLSLPQRADPRAALPVPRFVANRDARAHDGIAGPLWHALRACLERGEQGLVFVNRRGFAPSLKCASCAWEAQCPRCSARLTLHREPPMLRCHHCGHAERVPRSCPDCGNVDLAALGFGTQRLARALAETFPAARIARVDRDSTRARGAFAAMRSGIEAGEVDLMIGTQMLAKGHDFPRLTLVGVLGADNALYSADFRATERLFALLTQVAGRAGRAGRPGEVIVQTDFPTHPVYTALALNDYDRYARALLAERRMAELPPATHAALLTAEAHRRDDVDAALAAAHAAGKALAAAGDDGVTLFAPVPALLARRAGLERGQMVVQSERRGALHAFLAQWREPLDALAGKRVRLALDVDPAGFG